MKDFDSFVPGSMLAIVDLAKVENLSLDNTVVGITSDFGNLAT